MANDWIVVVDDDAMSLHNARDMLRDNQMRVSTARSGRDLLAFMERHSPDLILLDILMPEQDGFETYRLLREFESRAGRRPTPVIFLTGENDDATEQRGLTMGASDYIRKPFHQDILLRRIRNTIENSRTIENLTAEATRDKLTGFLNKAGTAAQLPVLCLTETGMLTILDLDSFKLVNDIYGHEMGDRVLTAFADIVRCSTRAEDVLCRIGGDEFLVFCRGACGEEGVAALTKRLNEQLTAACARLMGEDFGIPIGVSVGAVPVPEQGRDYRLLFPLADKALYQVKQNGKHGFAVYSDASDAPDAGGIDKELARMTRIMEERGEPVSALWLGQDAFTGAYRFLLRELRQTGGNAAGVLFRLTAENGVSREAAERFGELLGGALGTRDAVLQASQTQYFVLLPGRTGADAEALAASVAKEWKAGAYGDVGLDCAVRALPA
ncbi:MAG: diguanylate cyclase [Ruminococcaceae bacterium]|nr:diguanylate cyclase [Oscillospiraceae bacterium]